MLATSPSPLSISVAGRAGHAFEPHAMLQGFACHARGVELTYSTSTHVRARVRSKRMHDVELRSDHGRLVIACSCPARSLGLEVCKHAWAALLEVDRQGGLDDLRWTRGALVVDAAPLEPKDGSPAATMDSTALLEAGMTLARALATHDPKKKDKPAPKKTEPKKRDKPAAKEIASKKKDEPKKAVPRKPEQKTAVPKKRSAHGQTKR